MNFRVVLAVLACKLTRGLLRLMRRGGTALPGKAALKICPTVLETLSRGMQTIIVTGTNGKTTTCGMLTEILKAQGLSCLSNRSGANLLSGITAEFASGADWRGRPRAACAVETLKSIYDSIGRNRLNFDKGKKKETTQVNSAVTLSGQEMPTADVALFSRVIFLQFHKTEFSAEEKENYNLLKGYEKQGLSLITAEILKNRSFFVENYYDNFDIVLKDMFSLLKTHVVEDRILRNWCTILAGVRLLGPRLELPFTYQEISEEAVKLLINQNKQIASSNELATFWDMFEAMFDNNEIIDKWHFLVVHDDVINGFNGKINLKYGLPILKIKFTSIYKLYSEHAKRQNVKALPSTTLKYYLENSKSYLGCEKSTRFMRKDFVSAEGKAVQQNQVTSSFCFDYDALEINVIRTDDLFTPPVAAPNNYNSSESTPFD